MDFEDEVEKDLEEDEEDEEEEKEADGDDDDMDISSEIAKARFFKRLDHIPQINLAENLRTRYENEEELKKFVEKR